MTDSSVSSFSSTSLSEDDRRSIRRKRKKKRRHSDDRKRHINTKTSTSLTPAIAAPSDWEQLRAHFQFVLPTDDNNDDTNNNHKYGSNWQERMVQNYHAHLYKEYVLADLSRVLNIGKIGLRWRTEKEVADGRGFRCCGNLMCNKGSSSSNNTATASNKDNAQDREAYASAVKRHMGIAIPENGGKVPLGVLLPTESTASDALEVYLQSCADEQQQMMNQMQHYEHKKKKKKHFHDHKSKKPKRKHQNYDYSLKEQENNELARLESLPYGIGLHDYEVDFVYVEQQMKKRELVKVRLCLRCAPLLFIAKMNEKGSSSDKKAPAVKAREARELAARNHASSMTNANQSIDSSIT